MNRDGRVAALARRQWGVISRRQVEELGGDYRWIATRLRSGAWSEVLPGVLRINAAPDCWLQRAHASLLWLGEDAVLSHRSAAYLFGWTRRAPKKLEVLVPLTRRPRNEALIIRRTCRLSSRDLTARQGLRITNVPRTLQDLAGEPDITELLDAAVFRSKNTLEWLKHRVQVPQPGSYGASRLRQLVHELSPEVVDADSRMEAQLMRLFKRAKLRCSHHLNIIDDDGTFICEVDFAFPKERVLIEFDGWRFHWNRQAFDRRSDVLQRIAAIGWRLIPVTWMDLKERPAVVMERIRRALDVSVPAGAKAA